MEKHPFMKRAFAGAIDVLLIAILTVFIAMPMSSLTGYKQARADVDSMLSSMEQAYGVRFNLTPRELQELTEEQSKKYEEAFAWFAGSEENVRTYNRMVLGSYTTVLGSVLVAVLILELAVPLFFGNGQTLGKKLMGLVVIKMDTSPVDALGMIARAVLGKFLVEIAVPVFTILAIYNGNSGARSSFMIIGLFLVQAACMGLTKERRLIHDFLSGTRVVSADSEEFGV